VRRGLAKNWDFFGFSLAKCGNVCYNGLNKKISVIERELWRTQKEEKASDNRLEDRLPSDATNAHDPFSAL
jgi:hypothetical protein